MYKNYFGILLVLLMISQTSFAQYGTKNGFDKNHNFGVSVAYGKNAFMVSPSWTQYWGFGKYKNIRLGYGVRLNNFSGTDCVYTPAPPKHVADGSEILVADAQTNNIAITANIKGRFKEKIDAGFNIELFGIGYGGKKTATYTPSEAALANNPSVTGGDVEVKPQLGSLLLIGDRDIGMLNSELYAGYWFTPKLNIRLGLSYVFSEYKTTETIHFDNNRFRAKVAMPFVGLSFSPSRN